MKKLLLSSITFCVLSFSLSIVQIGCSKTEAQSPNTTLGQLNKIVYTMQNTTNPNILIEIWTCNYDGTNQTQIPITVPTDVEINTTNERATARISPDGQKVFFVGMNTTTNLYSIYSVNISGGLAQQIVAPSTRNFIEIGGAY